MVLDDVTLRCTVPVWKFGRGVSTFSVERVAFGATQVPETHNLCARGSSVLTTDWSGSTITEKWTGIAPWEVDLTDPCNVGPRGRVLRFRGQGFGLQGSGFRVWAFRVDGRGTGGLDLLG